ncbi:hypothetical protein L204_100194 [Cryptococcus depauperatus]
MCFPDTQKPGYSAVTQSPTSIVSPKLAGQKQQGDLAEAGNGKVNNISYLIVSGGTGANFIAGAFGHSPAFVLPVSDDGGSSSEILRCFGGPSIGDIRSRLIRLIPLAQNPSTREDKERAAIYRLMAHRFPADSSENAVRDMWHEIVEGKSCLWEGIGEDKKECIRAFLVHFETQCLKRAHKRFSFRNFSLGNGFLTGARDLFGSLPSAVFLFKSIAGVSSGAQVIPCINTNQTVTIAAELTNRDTLVGQCNISHPSPDASPTSSLSTATQKIFQKGLSSMPPTLRSHFRKDSRTFDTPDAITSPIHQESTDWQVKHDEEEKDMSNLAYRKGEGEVPLDAKIKRVFYINLYGQEIYPDPNTDFLESLHKRDVLVYSCGSLWTSIVPCLALRSLAKQIATSPTLRAKVLLVNSNNDRETSNYLVSDHVATILAMLRHYDKPKTNKSHEQSLLQTEYKANELISHIVWLDGCRVEIDEEEILRLGIKIIKVPQIIHGAKSGETPLFSNEVVEWAMDQVLCDVDPW